MLDKDQAAEIFDRIQKHSTADEVEVLFFGGRVRSPVSPTTRFIRMSPKRMYAVSVRTVFGGRTARATTNKLDDESLKRVVRSFGEVGEGAASRSGPVADARSAAEAARDTTMPITLF